MDRWTDGKPDIIVRRSVSVWREPLAGRQRTGYDAAMNVLQRLCPPRRRSVLAGLALAVLAGCGGGIYLEWEHGWIGWEDDWDRHAPDVSLVVSPTSAPAGATVTLSAAASDDQGIDEVIFFRRSGSSNVLLGSVGRSPYTWTTTLPLDASGSVGYFARAVDVVNRRTDSATVSVTITP
jgi:hypothetical protein